MDSCLKHPHEPGVAICGRCGAAWCKDCLVYAFGPSKPPFCMECAMFAGGVRSAAPRPAMAKRDLKKLQKQVKAEAKAAAKAGADLGQGAEAEAEPVKEPETAGARFADTPPAAPASDWETPWWEDRQPSLAD